MKRNDALKIVNPVLGLLVLSQFVTGVSADAIGKEAFAILHQGAAFVLVSVALLHVILNWNWIKANFLGRTGQPEK